MIFRYWALLLIILFFLAPIFEYLMVFIFSHVLYLVFIPFYTVILEGAFISVGSQIFEIAKECVAPSMYILITVVFFSVPLTLRECSILWLKSILWISIFNLVRIIVLILIALNFGVSYFDQYHFIFYELVNGVMLALVILYFHPKKRNLFPIYTDLKVLYKKLR